MVNSPTRHAHTPLAAERILLNGERLPDELGLLRTTVPSNADHNDRSAPLVPT